MKKSISILLCAVIFVSIYVVGGAYLAGDIDGNGKVNAADARYALRVAAKLENADEQQQKICDINADGKVNAADARTILRIAAKLESGEAKPDIQTVELNENALTKVLTPAEIYNVGTEYTCEVFVFGADNFAISRATGFFITADGVLVTNYHVIKSASSITVKNGNENYSVTAVLGYDSAKDIAILKTTAQNVKYATVNNSYNIGDDIYTIGNPKGMVNTFAHGNISFADRIIAEKNNGVEYIQITAPVSRGSSGGPLLDNKGNVIGVVSMTHDSAQNLNFAVPCAEIKKIDISSPQTLEQFELNDNTFNGTIVMSADGVTLKTGDAAVIYAIYGMNNYTLACKTNSPDVTAYIDERLGNVYPVYVFGNAEGSAQITVYVEGHEEVCATFFVTVT